MVKARRKKSSRAGIVFWVITLLLLGGAGAGWYAWRSFFQRGPAFDAILFSVNQEPKRVPAGGVLFLHPRDRLKILRISTNIPLNHHLRLVSQELDIAALRFEELPLQALLPGQNIYEHFRFGITVKHENEVIGSVELDVSPYLEDWLERAARVIDPVEKARFLKKAVGLHPKERKLQQLLADAYTSAGRWDDAAELLETMWAANEDPALLMDAINAYGAAGDTEDVIRLLKEHFRRDPGDVSSIRRLARLLDERGRTQEAVGYYEELLGLIPLEERLPVHSRLARIHADAGHHREAVRHYLEIARITPDDPNVYYNLSYLYDRLGEKEKANQYLEMAVKLNKGDMESRLKLAHDLVEHGQWKEARRHLEQVLAARPDDYEALLLMAQVLEKIEDKIELRSVYGRIVQLDPDNDAALYNLGVLEYQTDRLEESLKHLSAYARRHPDDPTVHTLLFDIYRRRQQTEDALREARLLSRLTPSNLSLYPYLFETLQDRGDYAAIIETMVPAIAANPEEATLRQYLVVAYLETGREDLAMLQLEEILKLEPDNHKLWLLLARLREKHRYFAQALEAYKRVLELVPQHEEASEAFLRLRLMNLDDAPEP